MLFSFILLLFKCLKSFLEMAVYNFEVLKYLIVFDIIDLCFLGISFLAFQCCITLFSTKMIGGIVVTATLYTSLP